MHRTTSLLDSLTGLSLPKVSVVDDESLYDSYLDEDLDIPDVMITLDTIAIYKRMLILADRVKSDSGIHVLRERLRRSRKTPLELVLSRCNISNRC